MVTAARTSRTSSPATSAGPDARPGAGRRTVPRLAPGTAWADALTRAGDAAPEAFGDGRLLNLWGGRWRATGVPLAHSVSPVDGSPITGPPMIELDEARAAIGASLQEHQHWRDVSLAERRARVTAAVDALDAHRDTLALLLVWEIGKPWRLARTDVDRAIDGVRWYVEDRKSVV